MDSQEKLRQQMAQIGNRYLVRTLGELEKLKELIGEAVGGSNTVLREVEHLAHKIHGSGAMFGFDAVSDSAGVIEHAAARLSGRDAAAEYSSLSDAELRRRLDEGVTQLEAVTKSAAQKCGVDVNAG